MDFDFLFPLVIGGSSCIFDYTPFKQSPFQAEQFLISNPTEFQLSLKTHVQNGAKAILAPTFSMSYAQLEKLFPDMEEAYENLYTHLIGLTRAAVGENIAVGGCVPPTDLTLRPYGDTSFEEICNIYFRHIRLLRDAGADFILINRQNSLADIRAALLVCHSLSIPSLTLLETNDDGETANGTAFFPALVTAQALGTMSLGLYDENAKSNRLLFKKAETCRTIPLLLSCTEQTNIERVRSAVHRGVGVVLTGCHTDLTKQLTENIGKEEFCFADTDVSGEFAAVEREMFFLPDDIELTEPILCDGNIEEKLIEIEENSDGNMIFIYLNTPDDAILLAEYGSFATMPIMVHTNNITVLKTALRCFQGRLVVDKNCDIDEGDLLHVVRKYGGILY